MARPFRCINEAPIAGVCGGLAYGLGVPALLVRLVFIAAVLGYGVGVGVYLILALVMPNWDEDPADYREITRE